MEHQTIINIFIFLMLIYLFYNKSTEGFGSVDDKSNEAISNVASLYNAENLTVSNLTVLNKITSKDIEASENVTAKNVATSGNLTVSGSTSAKNIASDTITTTGNATVNGLLTVKNGSSFSGGRHYFKDEENVGNLRVGAAWGIPGIYSESGNVVVGSPGEIRLASASHTIINNNVRDHLLIPKARASHPAGLTRPFFYVNDAQQSGWY